VSGELLGSQVRTVQAQQNHVSGELLGSQDIHGESKSHLHSTASKKGLECKQATRPASHKVCKSARSVFSVWGSSLTLAAEELQVLVAASYDVARRQQENTVLIAQNRLFLHLVGLLAWKATLLQGLVVHELVSGTCQLLPEECNLKLCVLDERQLQHSVLFRLYIKTIFKPKVLRRRPFSEQGQVYIFTPNSFLPICQRLF
jgi:hypothetical protein